MADLPFITIITVVYNGAKNIKTTIESVLNLPYPHIDYIIIDGCSKDGTQDIIKTYESKLFYWVSEPDKGIYDAMNKGWAKAKPGSYIIFLGAGDYIISLPDMSNVTADIIYGNVWCGDLLFNASADFRLRLINSVHHQAELVKKNIQPQPPFNLAYPFFADFDFNQRLFKRKLSFKKEASFVSYALEFGVSNNASKKEMLDIVKKNYGAAYRLLAKMYYAFQGAKALITKKSITSFK
ncbi:MAG: glycosyltransferase [Parafilimonas sp.]|nr:glycosyltransferase [Parafilimonas sp.]